MTEHELKIDGIAFTGKVVYEPDICWKTQNQIHYLLNTAFSKKSKSFIVKTYARTLPSERAMIFMDDVLVAHMGISSDQMLVNGQNIVVGCMGLWCADRVRDPMLKLKLATEVLKVSMDHLQQQGIEMAIGVTNSKAIENRIMPKVRSSVIDIPLHGRTTKSKDSDKFLLFNCGADDDIFNKLSDDIRAQGQVTVGGEIF